MEEKAISILKQAGSLFMRYGIKSVTMDDISQEMGISKKTLYSNFSDKAELIKSFLLYHIDYLNNEFGIIYKKDVNALESLMLMSRHLNRFLNDFSPNINYDLQKYYPEIWKMLMNYKSEHVYTRVKNNIEKGIKEGLYRTDIQPKIIARIYVLRIKESMNSDFFPLSEFSFADILREIIVYHIRGIVSPKGLVEFEKMYSGNILI